MLVYKKEGIECELGYITSPYFLGNLDNDQVSSPSDMQKGKGTLQGTNKSTDFTHTWSALYWLLAQELMSWNDLALAGGLDFSKIW